MILQDFFDRLPIQTQETAAWGNGEFIFRVTSYFLEEMPPDEYITSARGIIIKTRDNPTQVLTVLDTDGLHIVPGGKREAGETLEETLHREVLEETGWQISSPELLGAWHYHHLKPAPPGYAYPYPDFIQVIYAAAAVQSIPTARRSGDFELDCQFMPVEAVMKMKLTSHSQVLFLHLALSKGKS